MASRNKKKLVHKDVVDAIAIENMRDLREALNRMRLSIANVDESDDCIAMRGTLVLRQTPDGFGLEFVERA